MGLTCAKVQGLAERFTNLSCLDRSLGMVNTGMIKMEHMERHGPSLAAGQNHGGSHLMPPSDF
jgi:hypothetical protein